MNEDTFFSGVPAFNRTSLELKRIRNTNGGRTALPFNRTSLELKRNLWSGIAVS